MAIEPISCGFIGFGEAAQAFASGWRQKQPALELRAYDIKTDGADAATKHADYTLATVTGCETIGGLAGLNIFSLVTADQARAAAVTTASHLKVDAFYFDCNSCAPQTKSGSAVLIEAVGGHYVDVAIMSPVHPKLHKSPLLISGPHAEAALEFLTGLGMVARIVPGDVGAASSVKMIRSIMIKGLEAVVLECVTAGRLAGVNEMVFDSLDLSYPGFNWRKQATRMMERATTHGKRRASEMREVAKTVDMLGLRSLMSSATVEWMEMAGQSGGRTAGQELDYAQISDLLLAVIHEPESEFKPKPEQGESETKEMSIG